MNKMKRSKGFGHYQKPRRLYQSNMIGTGTIGRGVGVGFDMPQDFDVRTREGWIELRPAKEGEKTFLGFPVCDPPDESKYRKASKEEVMAAIDRLYEHIDD